MNRLSIRSGLLLLILFFTISAWAPVSTARPAHSTRKAFPFYFYTYPDYTSMGLMYATDAEMEMINYYGYIVDQYWPGGTLVAVGYATPIIYGTPSVKLYAHLPLQP